MKKIVVIGANDFQNQLILKAKSLGYETHVFAWRDGAVGEKTADFFYPISIVEKDAILEECKRIKPDGICSIASDLAAITVNYVAEKLGLPCNATKHTEIQTNKYAMRKALLKGGIPCPKFVIADEGTELVGAIADFSYPIIVKPTDRSGSRSITKLESAEGLENAVKEACAVSFEKKAIIEEFLQGDEYSMETVSFKGKHCFLAVTKKYTTGAPHFIETGHTQPSDLSDETVERAKATVFAALDALHIENSAGHSEFKVDADGNIRIIEIGARMGGDCIGSDLVYLSTGNDFVKMVIDVACGQAPEVLEKPMCKKAEIRFLFTKEDLEGFYKFEAEHPELIYRKSEFETENMGKVTDSSTRIGYYIIYDN
ncbi:MAG: ATP-grasp domain-containing protein [Clostridia bacterium]|nr:ATP-grasp domain-containing protein [Clostridia bacterium]MBQ4647532.1 ATP-grasp domain-containing protein [Clostridia bacterium]